MICDSLKFLISIIFIQLFSMRCFFLFCLNFFPHYLHYHEWFSVTEIILVSLYIKCECLQFKSQVFIACGSLHVATKNYIYKLYVKAFVPFQKQRRKLIPFKVSIASIKAYWLWMLNLFIMLNISISHFSTTPKYSRNQKRWEIATNTSK